MKKLENNFSQKKKKLENNSGTILSAGSVDNKFATCAAEASNPSTSSGASSERSATSNPTNSKKGQSYVWNTSTCIPEQFRKVGRSMTKRKGGN